LIGLVPSSAADALLPAIAVAVLALVGGLAAACFVRLVGIAFLGAPRSREAERAHEGGPLLVGPGLLLAAACGALGLFPSGVVALAGPVAEQVLGPALASSGAVHETAATLTPIGVAAGVGWALVAGGAVLGAARARSRRRRTAETWGCGYAEPSARMQYTARSFSELLAERLLPRWLAPRVRAPALRASFPATASLVTEEGDPLTRGVYEPLFVALATRCARLRALQQRNAHIYLTYILGAVVVALAWTSLRASWSP